MTTTAKRALVGSFAMSPEARQRDGHLVAWTKVAKDAAALYLDEIQRHPDKTVVLTLTVEP